MLQGPTTSSRASSSAAVAVRARAAGRCSMRRRSTALEPPTAEDTTALIFANAGIILMFIGIFTYGTWVLSGVVEEKQSRVVEVVLSTVRPRDLLMGKVLGIGVLALAQLVVLVAAGIGAAQLQRPPDPAPDHRRSRASSCSPGSCSGSRCTPPRWGAWARSRRGWRRRRTRRCR